MSLSRLLKRTVFLSDRSTGKPEQYSIVVSVPPPQPGSDGTAADAKRQADAVIDDAQAIFEKLVASGALTAYRR